MVKQIYSKLFFFFLGVLSIILILISYTFFYQPTQINYRNNGKIVTIDSEVVNRMNNDYKNFEVEDNYCLSGTIDNQTINISDIVKLKRENSTQDRSTFKVLACKKILGKNAIGVIHNHPPSLFNELRCKFSKTDLISYGITSSYYENQIIWGLQCGINKFRFIEQNDNKEYFDESLRVILK